jgi:DNA invertase Pin-like site-specific DNA recombinase
MDAQRTAVASFLKHRAGSLLSEFSEAESGKRNDRPELQKAIALCRKAKATLVIAKLDRLARNAAFLFNLRDSGIDFVCADMPDANRLTIGILAVVAENERELISQRTKAGLAEAKRRGIKLGCPNPLPSLRRAWKARSAASERFAAGLAPAVREIQRTGVTTLRELAACLNRRGYRTPNGKTFYPQSVKNLLRVIAGD